MLYNSISRIFYPAHPYPRPFLIQCTTDIKYFTLALCKLYLHDNEHYFLLDLLLRVEWFKGCLV